MHRNLARSLPAQQRYNFKLQHGTFSCNAAQHVATRRNPAQAVATQRTMLQRGEQVTSARC
jgi:hypothetical protein